MHEVLFNPFVTVNVTDEGEVESVRIDWSDSLRNVFTSDGEAVWEDDRTEEPPTAKVASAYLDAQATRARALLALQPQRADRFTIEDFGRDWCVVDHAQVGSDGGELIVGEYTLRDEAEAVIAALENVLGGPSGPTPV